LKKVFVKDIKERDHVSDAFLVSRKDTGMSKTGKPYLNLRLMDSTGDIEARVWDDAEGVGRLFGKNDVVSIKGYAVAYQGGLQVNVSSMSRVPDGGYSIRDFLPSSQRDPAEMAVELDGIIAGMKDAGLKALLKSIFGDPDVRERFMTAPAAKTMHHPYIGGLIEHVLSMCGLAGAVSGHYGVGVDRDLLVAGAILHDIGKIYELSYKRAFDYTDEGRLLGHITIGIGLIDAHIKRVAGFPDSLAVVLKHMILSHHGHLEFGSPKRPKTLEAIMLYYLDDMDAKVSAVKSLMKEGRAEDERWTPYQRLFERYIYIGAPRPGKEVELGEGAKAGERENEGNGPLGLF
jgi:3'-5' exoribonuclease